jgi:lactoylglutathione lyase
MIILSTDDLEESLRFYSQTLGMALKFRDDAHFVAFDAGSVTLALATAVDHPIPGQVVVGIKTGDVDAAAKAVEASGGGGVKGPTTTHTNAAPLSTTTKATAWSSIDRWPGERRSTTRHFQLRASPFACWLLPHWQSTVAAPTCSSKSAVHATR